MTPEQALQFFRQWTMEIMPLKHIDQFNTAFVLLSKLIEDAKPKPPDKPNG